MLSLSFQSQKNPSLSVPDVNFILLACANDNSDPCCTLCCLPLSNCLRKGAEKGPTLLLDPLLSHMTLTL